MTSETTAAASEPSTSRFAFFRRIRSSREHRALALTLAALLLILAAFGFRAIATANSDLPPLALLAEDVRQIYAPSVHADAASAPEHAAWHDPAPIVRQWKLAWLRLNGQIDARVLALAGLAVNLAALAVLFRLLARELKVRWLALLAAAIVAGCATPLFTALRPSADPVWPGLLMLISLAHLGLMTAGGKRWSGGLGFACGALNVVGFTAGLASTFALIGFGGWRAMQKKSWREQLPLIVSHLVLLAGGILLALGRSHHSSGESTHVSPFAAQAHAPFWWLLLIWLPAIFGLTRWLRRRAVAEKPPTLFLLILWLLVQLATLAVVGAPTAEPATILVIFSVVLNAACFIALPAVDRTQRTRNLVLVALWAIVVAHAPVSWLEDASARTPLPPNADSPSFGAWRSALAQADFVALRSASEGSNDEKRAVAEIVQTGAAIARILPVSIRPALRITEASPLAAPSASESAFQSEGAPELTARDGLPIFGTWSKTDANAATGEFVSAPLTTTFPFVQMRVSGTLRPPQTSLVLRTEDGAEIAPLDDAFTSEHRWKRVHFPAPRGPFRIVARDASATTWMAFTAPIEVSHGSRFAGKIPSLWPWLLAAGVLLGLVGGTDTLAAIFRAQPTAASSPREAFLAWRVVPWVIVAGYAVFFSHHLDTTAGPNDSGGYLNSAKLLVAGQLSGAPRVPFASSAAQPADITPFLPITFQENAGRMVPEYPVGFPLEIWAVAQLLPLKFAVPTLMLVQLVLGAWFTRALGRVAGLSDAWAWLGAGLVAFSPVYLFEALQPVSDGPALVWVTAAVYWAWTSRERPWHAWLAGAATALAVMIRPSNLLCVVPVLLCLAGRPRQLLHWALAGIPGALWLGWYQQTLYGSWHRTGYGEVDSAFGVRFVLPTLRSYVKWLPEFFTPLVCLGFIAPWLRSIPGRVRLVLTTWIAVFVVFYAFYWCTWDTWFNMRFLLPAAPAMVVLSLLALQRGFERFGVGLFTLQRSRDVLVSTALGLSLFGFLWLRNADRRVLYWMGNNHEGAAIALWARDHLPANAVVFAKSATGALTYYTELAFVRLDHATAKNSTALYEQITQSGRPIYALTYHWEQRDYREENGHGTGDPGLPGTWDRIATLWAGDAYVWKQRPLALPNLPASP